MALGSTINYSVPAVGTTVNAIEKLFDGAYADGNYFTDTNGVDVPLTTKYTPVALGGSSKSFAIKVAFNPAIHNQALAGDQGKCTVTINCAFREGIAIDSAEAQAITSYAMSLLIPHMTTLCSGSLE